MLQYFGFYDTPDPRAREEKPAQSVEPSPDAPRERTSARLRHTEPVEPPGRAWEVTG